MATATGTSTLYDSSGNVYAIITEQITYTLTNYDDRAVITLTKYEEKINISRQNVLASSINIYTYNASGNMDHNSISIPATVLTPSYTTRWSGSQSYTCYKTTINRQITINHCTVPVNTLTTYRILYSAPDSSGGPTEQTKYYNVPLSITNVKPTKPGYTLVNWLSSYDSKYYLPNDLYTLNASTTMTAQWGVNTYTVSYDANGGSGIVPSQSKVYNTAANFQLGTEFSNKELQNGITREYELLKWNSQPDGSGNEYALGSEIPNITNNLKVYAIWRGKYLYPYIGNLQAYRTATASISDKDRAAKGEYIYISFDFIGCSSNDGALYTIPNCKITIDEDEYTPTLTFDSGEHSGSAEFKANVTYSMDNPHNVTVELWDPNHTSSKFKVFDYITTSIYPIDLLDNPDTNKVYMGIMHPYTENELLTIPETYVDGEIKMHLDIDANASRTNPAVSGEDKDLFNAILDNDWYDDVINADGKLLLKKQLWKTSEPSDALIPTPITFTYKANNYVPSDKIWISGYKWGCLIVVQLSLQVTVAIPSQGSAFIGSISELAEPQGSYSYRSYIYTPTTNGTYNSMAQVATTTNGHIGIFNPTRSDLWADSRIQALMPIITTF